MPKPLQEHRRFGRAALTQGVSVQGDEPSFLARIGELWFEDWAVYPGD